MRCTRSSIRGLFSAGVPVAYGFLSLLALLFIYSKLFYTNFYPASELVESIIRYLVAGVLLAIWLVSWYRFASWWKRYLISISGQSES